MTNTTVHLRTCLKHQTRRTRRQSRLPSNASQTQSCLQTNNLTNALCLATNLIEPNSNVGNTGKYFCLLKCFCLFSGNQFVHFIRRTREPITHYPTSIDRRDRFFFFYGSVKRPYENYHRNTHYITNYLFIWFFFSLRQIRFLV